MPLKHEENNFHLEQKYIEFVFWTECIFIFNLRFPDMKKSSFTHKAVSEKQALISSQTSNYM